MVAITTPQAATAAVRTTMSFISDRPPPGQVDPRDLTAGQLTALGVVAGYRLTRQRDGWQCAGSPKVTLATAAILSARRLVMQRNVNGQPRLKVTGTGMNTLAVAEQRKAARRG